MLGIIEEQHPDRARLFMQWKKMGWPVLVDSLGRLGVSVVPLTLAIDENGIIRKSRLTLPEASNIERDFIRAADFPAPGTKPPAPVSHAPDWDRLRKAALAGDAGDWRKYGDVLYLWGGIENLDEALGAFQKAVEMRPEAGPDHFRLGVAYRRWYDSPQRQDGDFQAAVDQWARALDLDPNSYIWRRRLQQYGPRLDKPYPFYDWVRQARRDLQARGETPWPLPVEPGGAEIARPETRFIAATRGGQDPDPEGRITRDPGTLIAVETTVVPPEVRPGQAVRVHMSFCPRDQVEAHWNNEVEELAVAIQPPDGWQADRRLQKVPNPPTELSHEVRTIEFEVQSPRQGPESARIEAYALYYVCEGIHGTCLYRRQDVSVPVRVRSIALREGDGQNQAAVPRRQLPGPLSPAGGR